MRAARRHVLLIPLAALLAVLPLMVHGCSCGHDFDFHLLNWIEAQQQLLHGHFPQWAYTPAWNAGEPRFVFYPPLSWLLGALLGLAMPWTWTPVAYTWVALTASGLAMYRLARAYVGTAAATVAATVYLANPYMLFTAYERTAYAELLAAAWMPLLLRALLAEDISAGAVALPVALLWLTNAPAAVMGCYALAFVGAMRLVWARTGTRWGMSLRTAAGTAFGLGLVAFYLLPAAYEQRYVQVAMAVIPGMQIADNTLFHVTGDGPHDEVLHTASGIALILLAVTVLALVIARIAEKARHPERSARRPERSKGSLYVVWAPTILGALTVAIALLLTRISLPVWHSLPELKFLQFPWRLLAVLAAVTGLAVALAVERLWFGRGGGIHIPEAEAPPRPASAAGLKPRPIWSLLAATILIYPAYRVFAQACDPGDTVAARLALFHSAAGSDPTDEYTPAAADNDKLLHADPPYWLLAPQMPEGQPRQDHPGQAPKHLELNLPAPAVLVLNLRDYPSWRITRNGAPVPQTTRDDGLIDVALPAGASTIDIAEIRLWDRWAGDGLSAVALLAGAALRRRRRSDSAAIA